MRIQAWFVVLLTGGTACAQSATLEFLGRGPDDTDMTVRALSNDGSTVGGTTIAGRERRAFVWSDTHGLVLLPQDSGFTGSVVTSLSSDGTVAVGIGRYGNPAVQTGFRWIIGSGVEVLSSQDGTVALSNANDIDGSGSVVVGSVRSVGELRAAVWTPEHGVVLMPSVPGHADAKEATSITEDGRLVGGYGGSASFGFLFDREQSRYTIVLEP